MAMNQLSTERGYIAMSTVIVVGALLVTIGVGVVMNSLNSVLSSFSGNKSKVMLALVDACVEEALLEINETDNVVSPIVLPAGNCTVTINSNVGGNWDFTVSGTFEGYTRSIQITATKTTLVTVNSRKEI